MPPALSARSGSRRLLPSLARAEYWLCHEGWDQSLLMPPPPPPSFLPQLPVAVPPVHACSESQSPLENNISAVPPAATKLLSEAGKFTETVAQSPVVP